MGSAVPTSLFIDVEADGINSAWQGSIDEDSKAGLIWEKENTENTTAFTITSHNLPFQFKIRLIQPRH